jgi:hypothetical protein
MRRIRNFKQIRVHQKVCLFILKDLFHGYFLPFLQFLKVTVVERVGGWGGSLPFILCSLRGI